jgi:hypothetical protein
MVNRFDFPVTGRIQSQQIDFGQQLRHNAIHHTSAAIVTPGSGGS